MPSVPGMCGFQQPLPIPAILYVEPTNRDEDRAAHRTEDAVNNESSARMLVGAPAKKSVKLPLLRTQHEKVAQFANEPAFEVAHARLHSNEKGTVRWGVGAMTVPGPAS